MDAHDNCYFMLRGQKTFTLFSPDSAGHMKTMFPAVEIAPNGFSFHFTNFNHIISSAGIAASAAADTAAGTAGTAGTAGDTAGAATGTAGTAMAGRYNTTTSTSSDGQRVSSGVDGLIVNEEAEAVVVGDPARFNIDLRSVNPDVIYQEDMQHRHFSAANDIDDEVNPTYYWHIYK
jgi:hypothetical protein